MMSDGRYEFEETPSPLAYRLEIEIAGKIYPVNFLQLQPTGIETSAKQEICSKILPESLVVVLFTDAQGHTHRLRGTAYYPPLLAQINPVPLFLDLTRIPKSPTSSQSKQERKYTRMILPKRLLKISAPHPFNHNEYINFEVLDINVKGARIQTLGHTLPFFLDLSFVGNFAFGEHEYYIGMHVRNVRYEESGSYTLGVQFQNISRSFQENLYAFLKMHIPNTSEEDFIKAGLFVAKNSSPPSDIRGIAAQTIIAPPPPPPAVPHQTQAKNENNLQLLSKILTPINFSQSNYTVQEVTTLETWKYVLEIRKHVFCSKKQNAPTELKLYIDFSDIFCKHFLVVQEVQRIGCFATILCKIPLIRGIGSQMFEFPTNILQNGFIELVSYYTLAQGKNFAEFMEVSLKATYIVAQSYHIPYIGVMYLENMQTILDNLKSKPIARLTTTKNNINFYFNLYEEILD